MTETKAKCMNFGGCLKVIYKDPEHHCICDNARILTKHLPQAIVRQNQLNEVIADGRINYLEGNEPNEG